MADAKAPMKVPLPSPVTPTKPLLLLDGSFDAAAIGAARGPSDALKATSTPVSDASGKGKIKKAVPKESRSKEEEMALAAKIKAQAKAKAKGKGKGKPTQFRLNVRNLHVAITSEKLTELFEPFGKVIQAQVRLHEDGTSRTIGYVVYGSEEHANDAMEKMHGAKVKGRLLKVEPAEFKPSAKSVALMQQTDLAQRQAYMQYMAFARQHQMAAYMQHMHLQASMAAHYQQAAVASYMQQAAYEEPYIEGDMAGFEQWDSEQMADYSLYGDESWQGYGGALGFYGEEGELYEEGVSEEMYEGVLQHKKDDYGFIKCENIFALYGRDVYIDAKVLPLEAQIGDRLQFEMEINSKGHPKATWASVLP